jgi:two-component system, NarL family, response regulator NreC
MTRIGVVIADDHAVLRAGLRLLLEAQPDMLVLGDAADGAEVVQKVRTLRPDVVVMDLSMPGPRSGTVIRQVRRACPATRVLVLTLHDDPSYLRASMFAGAAGYLVKRAADSELMSAIRAVHAGRTFVDLTRPDGPKRSLRGRTAVGADPPKPLSQRERTVLRLLAQGHSNQAIADRLRVSIKTIETYRTRLSQKLGLKGRAQLYRFASEAGILDAERVTRSPRD